ncbi:hypothetical protein LINPERHAP2_LOCUS14314 [Linum perenne]
MVAAGATTTSPPSQVTSNGNAIQKILYASDNDGKAIAEAQAMVASFVHQQKEEEEAAKVVSLTDSQK